jgi:lysophospholipid acyltransferase (LPLAT)-like uncharacterized protein
MRIKNIARNFCYRHLFPRAGLLLVGLLSRTYRYRLVDEENEQRTLDTYGSVVYASWHQRFFPGITLFAARKPIAIMISQSRDGEMIAHVVDMLGWRSVRGSSSRGGPRALKQIRTLTRQGFRIGHIVDGPQGPFGVVKPGLLVIAQFAGTPIVPVIFSAQRYWRFNSWDRFMVPKPFSRIVVRFAPPISVPRRLDAEAFEALRLDIENRMKEYYETADESWNRPDILKDCAP